MSELNLRNFAGKIFQKMKTTILEKTYPVGSVYISVNSTDPSQLFGGTWKRISQGRVLWGADDSHEAGTIIEAGLPNITGHWSINWNTTVRGFHDLFTDGAFYSTIDTSRPGRVICQDQYANNSSHCGIPNFDASRSNAIYGRSDTVTPPHTLFICGREQLNSERRCLL